MSHFTTVATKINNIQCLLKALEKLKLKYTHSEQGVEVRGWRGQKSTAEASINMGRYDIGVVKNEDGTYRGRRVRVARVSNRGAERRRGRYDQAQCFKVGLTPRAVGLPQGVEHGAAKRA